jgi:hypothetical protein
MQIKVGDLVRDSHLNVGIIIKRRKWYPKHWWVLWRNGDSHTIHERFLEVIQ